MNGFQYFHSSFVKKKYSTSFPTVYYNEILFLGFFFNFVGNFLNNLRIIAVSEFYAFHFEYTEKFSYFHSGERKKIFFLRLFPFPLLKNIYVERKVCGKRTGFSYVFFLLLPLHLFHHMCSLHYTFTILWIMMIWLTTIQIYRTYISTYYYADISHVELKFMQTEWNSFPQTYTRLSSNNSRRVKKTTTRAYHMLYRISTISKYICFLRWKFMFDDKLPSDNK